MGGMVKMRLVCAAAGASVDSSPAVRHAINPPGRNPNVSLSERPGSECPGSECPGSECPGSECPGSECSGSKCESRRLHHQRQGPHHLQYILRHGFVHRDKADRVAPLAGAAEMERRDIDARAGQRGAEAADE